MVQEKKLHLKVSYERPEGRGPCTNFLQKDWQKLDKLLSMIISMNAQ